MGIVVFVQLVEVEDWGGVDVVHPGDEVYDVWGHRNSYRHGRVSMPGSHFSLLFSFGPQTRREGRRVILTLWAVCLQAMVGEVRMHILRRPCWMSRDCS